MHTMPRVSCSGFIAADLVLEAVTFPVEARKTRQPTLLMFMGSQGTRVASDGTAISNRATSPMTQTKGNAPTNMSESVMPAPRKVELTT